MPSDPEDSDERALGELVLGYLDEHLHAMETLEGVAEWWIERRRIRVNVEALSRALTHLTRRARSRRSALVRRVGID